MMRDVPCTGPENVLEAKELVRKLRTIVAAALTWPVQSACEQLRMLRQRPGRVVGKHGSAVRRRSMSCRPGLIPLHIVTGE